MKRTLSLAAGAVALAALVSACNGGGGGGSHTPPPTGCTYNCNPQPTPAPVVWTHEDLAHEFVRRVNNEIANFDVELVKINTLQWDYIVVYDYQYGTYDAYYLGEFNPYGNVANYFNVWEDYFYYDLVPQWGGYYYDPITGTRFDKQQAAGKNLAKMKAFKEAIAIERVAEKFRAEYGLSAEKANDTARFAYKLHTSPAGTFNSKDFDAFAKELTGSTITEFQDDFKNGNTKSLSDRLQNAGEVTGMGPEGVNKLINDMFM